MLVWFWFSFSKIVWYFLSYFISHFQSKIVNYRMIKDILFFINAINYWTMTCLNYNGPFQVLNLKPCPLMWQRKRCFRWPAIASLFCPIHDIFIKKDNRSNFLQGLYEKYYDRDIYVRYILNLISKSLIPILCVWLHKDHE